MFRFFFVFGSFSFFFGPPPSAASVASELSITGFFFVLFYRVFFCQESDRFSDAFRGCLSRVTEFLPSFGRVLGEFFQLDLHAHAFYWVLLGFTEFYRVKQTPPIDFAVVYQVVPGFTEFYRLFLGFSRFYRVLPSFG